MNMKAGGNRAGVRYISPLIPFVYAYGIHRIFRLPDLAAARFKQFPALPVSSAMTVIVTAILLLPVVYPHRCYE